MRGAAPECRPTNVERKIRNYILRVLRKKAPQRLMSLCKPSRQPLQRAVVVVLVARIQVAAQAAAAISIPAGLGYFFESWLRHYLLPYPNSHRL